MDDFSLGVSLSLVVLILVLGILSLLDGDGSFDLLGLKEDLLFGDLLGESGDFALVVGEVLGLLGDGGVEFLVVGSEGVSELVEGLEGLSLVGLVVVEGVLGGEREGLEELDELQELSLVSAGGHFEEELGFSLVTGEFDEGFLELVGLARAGFSSGFAGGSSSGSRDVFLASALSGGGLGFAGGGVFSVSLLSSDFIDVSGSGSAGDGSGQFLELSDDGFDGVDDIAVLLHALSVLLDVFLSVRVVEGEGVQVVSELGVVLGEVDDGLVSEFLVLFLLGLVEGDLGLELGDFLGESVDFIGELLVELGPVLVGLDLVGVELVEEVGEKFLDFVDAAGVGEGHADGLNETVSVSGGSEFFDLG